MQVSVPKETASRGGLRALKLVLGLALSGVFLYATLGSVRLDEVADSLRQASVKWLLLAVGCAVLAYLIKTYRWTAMLRNLGARIGLVDTATPFVGSVAINNVLPFRAGDLLRVMTGERFTGIPPSGQAGSLILERLLDLVVLMGILFTTLLLQPVSLVDDRLLDGLRIAALAVAAGAAVFVAAPRLIRAVVRRGQRQFPRLAPAGEALLRLSYAVSTLSRPAFLLRMVVISLCAWLAEGGAYFAVAIALDLRTAPEAALLALSIGTLSTIIPSSPGYVGTFHYFTARAMMGAGAAAAAATAFAILVHALLWLLTTAAGFVLLGLSAASYKRKGRSGAAVQVEGKKL
jgi:uncharacterized membrane protein YbhN (UPF0104 family)